MKKSFITVLFTFALFVLGSTAAYAYEKIQVDSVDGTIWDYKDNRILFLDANQALKVKDQSSGQITTIAQGKLPIVGFLTPKGAIFLAKSDGGTSTVLYDWRDGKLTDLGQVDPTLIVKGNYAVYNVGSTIYLRDITTGESKVVTDNSDGQGYDLGSNGKVVWGDKTDRQIYSFLNGETKQITNTPEKQSFSPLTDGSSIVFTRVPTSDYGYVETVVNNDDFEYNKEKVVANFPVLTLFPYEDYVINNGFVATYDNEQKNSIYSFIHNDLYGYSHNRFTFDSDPFKSFSLSPEGAFLFTSVSDKVYYYNPSRSRGGCWSCPGPVLTTINSSAKVYWSKNIFVAEEGILSRVLIGGYDRLPVTKITPTPSSDWTSITEYTLTATDDGSSIRTYWTYRTGSEVKTYEGNVIKIPRDGYYEISYYSKDSGGQSDYNPSYRIRVDTTPPVTKSTITPISDNSTVKLTATDNFSGVKAIFYRINNGKWTRYLSPLTLSASEKNTLEFYSEDIAGNKEKTNSNAPTDITAPTTELLVNSAAPAPWYNTNVSVQLKAVDNESGSGIAKTYYRINGGTLQQYSAPFTLSDAGDYAIEYYSSDVAGNNETAKFVTLKIDKSAPVTKHTVVPISGGYSVKLTSTDNLSWVKKTFYRLNAGAWTAYSAPFTVPAGQAQDLEFYSEDNAGNKETVISIRVGTGDTTAPTTTLLANGAAPTAWYNTEINVQLTASDGESGSGVAKTYYRTNGGEWKEYSAPYTLSPPGTYKVEYYSSDLAGNKEAAKTVTLGIDKTAPITSYKITPVYGHDKPYRYIKSHSVTVTAKDILSGVKASFYRINGGAWARYTAPFNLPGSGNRNLEFYSEDNAENMESVANDADKTAPTTELLVGSAAPAAWYNTEINVQLKAADNKPGSGVSKTLYRINGGEWQEYSKLFTLTDPGAYKVEYYSTDLAGNIENAKSATVSIDKTAPVTKFSLSPVNEGYTVTLAATDDISGVKQTYYRLNHGTWIMYSAPFTLSRTGNQILEYYSEDNAGNEEQAATADTTAPITTLLANAAAPVTWYNKDINVELNAMDNESGSAAAKTFYRINGGAWQEYAKLFTLSDAGQYKVEFYSMDLAGNKEGTQSVTLGIDIIAPVTKYTITPVYGTDKPVKYIKGYTVTVTATDERSGVKETYYRFNQGEWTKYTSPFPLPVTRNLTLEFYSTDNAGNKESITNDADLTAPTTELLANSAAPTPWYHENISVELSAADNASGSGVSQTFYRINGGEWQEYSKTFTISDAGESTVEYYSTDLAGNIENAKAVTLRIDKTAPITKYKVDPVYGTDKPYRYIKGYTVSFTAADDLSGVKQTYYRLNKGEWTMYTTGITLTGTGDQNLEFYSEDNAGNQEVHS
ncbi:Ig-like domain repeat protein [Paenibacillus sp. sptzw28]|uniref:OmpL47-type beta-barrel domain-containing protein n=1 Tax=Paenibacillus sp. sptzw28 TaxID=715179 RepID=UPI001C6F37CE|nr:Ig-like domain repeat protein [Paenibacillus sp. sptzw28]QYR22875.1 Ig-like domain repeat protein [Paenibacillus sp. sptzw28]